MFTHPCIASCWLSHSAEELEYGKRNTKLGVMLVYVSLRRYESSF